MEKFCKIGCLASRYLLGLIFFVMGINGFFPFLPQPPLEPQALQFIMALVESGYLMMLVKAVEILCGAMLLSGLYVPLAVVLIGPNMVNILLFHVFLAGGIGLPAAMFIMWCWLIYCYRGYFKGVFTQKTTPVYR